MTAPSDTRSGLLLGVGAYLLWGLLPLYLHLLDGVPALQLVSHRVLWSLLLLAAVTWRLGRAARYAREARGRTLLLLCASAAAIAVNWLIYIWSVLNGHVLDASLGYFINPLVSVGLGVAFLRERLRPLQAAAVALAGLGVLVLASAGAGRLWIPLALAVSFGGYGLIRKVAAIDALGGLLAETLLLAPFAAAVLAGAGATGTAAFGRDAATGWLLALSGAVTTAPLLMFAAAARRLRLATLGLVQYLSPTLQLAEAVLLFGEPVRAVHAATFGLIWTGCALYAWDGWRGGRRAAAAAAAPVDA